MNNHGRDDGSWSLTFWWTVAVTCAVASFAVQRARAEPQAPFEQLAELDREVRHHALAAERIERTIARWEREFRAVYKEGELAERARGRLRARAARQLVAWEMLHRRLERRAILWRGGRARDLRKILVQPEIESLEDRGEVFSTIGRLRARTVDPALLVRRRAGLAVELAQHTASGEAAGAEKAEVVESAKEREGEELEEELDDSQEHLEKSLNRLIDHETGDDFHKRKGALLPPVSAEIVQGFGERKQDDSMTYVRHTGLTYEVESGTPVRATADGMVVFAERLKGYGRLVIVDHGDAYHSLYAHLAEVKVEAGQKVARGEPLGASGATDSLSGPKLYFELRHETEPTDPEAWFVRRKSEETDGED